ncbi:MAG: hypothetical protein H7A51_09495 [Akkermansiaceae bacterium]|nr:hypothetical protein [Akkermansiaceae bacterium]
MTAKTDPVLLQNKYISLEVLPEPGGKISSLVDRRTGREWLWKNPHLTIRQPVYGESYTKNIDFGGWDEIFPSISPVTLADGTKIPDHGELVFLPATVQQTGPHTLVTTWLGRAINTKFIRTITLEDSLVRVAYALESLQAQAVPYLWACHPLIALEPGMVLEVPTQRFLTRDTTPIPDLPITHLSSGGSRFDIADPQSDASVAAMAHKIFTTKGDVDSLKIEAADGGVLELSWDLETIPYLGLWLNLRGWSGCDVPPYFNLGIEPTTAPYDELLEAVESGCHRILAPGDVHRWSMQFRLNDHRS